jgi:hypothetical protein
LSDISNAISPCFRVCQQYSKQRRPKGSADLRAGFSLSERDVESAIGYWILAIVMRGARDLRRSIPQTIANIQQPMAKYYPTLL